MHITALQIRHNVEHLKRRTHMESMIISIELDADIDVAL